MLNHFPHSPVEWQERYIQRVTWEFHQLSPHLPDKIDGLLDIGCGLAGIDVFIARARPGAVVHLVDGYEMDNKNKKHGYNKQSTPWNDVDSAGKFVRDNCPDTKVVTHYYDRPLDIDKIDLIISMWSWGFHYPVSTYLPVALRHPRAGVVLDIRKRSNGLTAMYNAGYRINAIVMEGKKTLRCLFGLRS